MSFNERDFMLGGKNRVKQKVEQGETALGLVCRTLSPVVVEVIGLAGFDFVWIDMEHTTADFAAVEQLCRAADATGIESLVRVPDQNPSSILRALEAGAGIVNVPQVEEKAQVEAIVQAAKYPPLGQRGYCASSRGTAYGFGGTPKELFAAANERVMVMVQIESVRGVENAEALCSVPHLDVVFVGMADLAQSLGLVDQFTHPDLLDSVRRVLTAAKANRKIVAMLAETAEGARKWRGEGARILGCGVDIQLIRETFRSLRAIFEPFT